MRISDWSSDVCSSDLRRLHAEGRGIAVAEGALVAGGHHGARGIDRELDAGDVADLSELVDQEAVIRQRPAQRPEERHLRAAHVEGAGMVPGPHRGQTVGPRLARARSAESRGGERGCQYVEIYVVAGLYKN